MHRRFKNSCRHGGCLLLRWLVVIGVVIAASGCGVKLIYNNADRLTRGWVNDYIDLTAEQRRYLDSATAEIMYWHRTTQLVEYRDGLLELADKADRPLTRAEVERVGRQMALWGEGISDRATPVATQMLMSLSDQQLVEFQEALGVSNEEYLQDARRDLEKRQYQQARDYGSAMSRLVGRMTKAQRRLIEASHAQMQPYELALVNNRQAWQAQLVAVLMVDPLDQAKLEDLLGNNENYYTEEFSQMLEFNEEIYLQMTVALFKMYEPMQRLRLAAQLRELAEICDELIAEAGPAPPPPVPLVRPDDLRFAKSTAAVRAKRSGVPFIQYQPCHAVSDQGDLGQEQATNNDTNAYPGAVGVQIVCQTAADAG